MATNRLGNVQYNTASPGRTINPGSTGYLFSDAPCILDSYYISNDDSATIYYKFYDKATAGTSSDTPFMTVVLTTGQKANVAGLKLYCSLGLSVRATTGRADNDTGAPTANSSIVNVGYIT